MAFPDAFVDEVRRAADIVRVISDHVNLKKLGTSWKGLCPFHGEKTPSFNVRSDPAIFHCFGCGVGGDVFKFVMLKEGLSFPEAIEALARRHGIPIPDHRESDTDRGEREEILAVMEEAAQHFTRTLFTAGGTRAREYLLGRGFRKETLERIRAGAARDAWDDLLGTLRPKYSPEALLRAGLVIAREGGHGHYDRFRNRAIFPIQNEAGRVVAFGARSIDGSDPKYLNSPETAVYQKSRTLYGLSWARESIKRERRAVLMEGYLDVARALETGVTEAIATCGTALTGSHARLLRRFAERICVNFDEDDAGRRAARKALDVLLAEGVRFHVVALPEGHDPDSFLKEHGAAAYREILEKAPEGLQWLIDQAGAQHDTRTPGGKAAFLGEIRESLARIDSGVERAAWLARACERGGLDEQAAREEIRRFRAGRTGEPVAFAAAPEKAELVVAERWLLGLLAQGDPQAEEALSHLSEEEFAGLRTAPALRAAKALWRRGLRVEAAALQAEIADEDASRLTSALAVDGPPEGVSAHECVQELKRQVLRRRQTEIQKALGEASGANLDALLTEKNRITREIANL